MLRRITYRAAHLTHKLARTATSRQVFIKNTGARKNTRSCIHAVVRQRLHYAYRCSPVRRSGFRLLRLFSSEIRSALRVDNTSKLLGLRRVSAKALRKRLLRRNTRRTTSFFFDRRSKTKRRRVSRCTRRQGRRGYSGLFGKRRYRVGRRDKQLARRASKRTTIHRDILARTKLLKKTARNCDNRSACYKATALSQLLVTSGLSATVKPLSVGTTQRAYNAVRYFFAARLRSRRNRRHKRPLYRRAARGCATRVALARYRGLDYRLLYSAQSNQKSYYTLPKKYDYRH